VLCMKRIFGQFSLIAILVCCFPSAIASQHSATNRSIVVAYTEFPPYSSTDPQGMAEGFSIDLIERLVHFAGFEPRFVQAENPERMVEMLEEGAADLTTPLALTEERLARVLPTHEIGTYEMNAFVRSDRGFQTPDELTGQRVGVVRGSYGITGARQIPFAEIVELETSDDLIVPLLTGEVDAVVAPKNVMLRRLRDARIDHDIVPLDPALLASAYGLLVSRNRPDLQSALNLTIDQHLAASDLLLLKEKWFGRPRHFTENPAFWTVAVILTLCSLALAFLTHRLLVHRREARRLLTTNAANDLLIKALDEINAAIVIYDKDMRAIHRNTGFSKCFPGSASRVDRGIDMKSLIASGQVADQCGDQSCHIQNDAALDEIVTKAQRGADNTRFVPAPNGLVYEARDIKVGEAHYASIRVDVTALHLQQKVIREQADSLQKSNEQLQAFAALAAHDLQAPLRNISILVDFAKEDLEAAGLVLPNDVAEHLHELKSQSSRMSKLVEDLLHYARGNSVVSRAQWIDPVSVLDNSLSLMDERAGISLVLPEKMPDLFVDPTAFEAVMRNLIGNAIKHHDKPQGTVEVTSSVRDGYVDILVADDGAGIPDRYREAIFEPFKRLAGTTSGSGLGLAFVKGTVESWGGKISVKSLAPSGSLFTFSIPVPEG